MVPQGKALVMRAWRALPKGGLLPEEVWRRRHRGIVGLLWINVIGVVLLAVANGYGLVHSVLESAIITLLALVAGRLNLPRVILSSCATLGLVASSAMLVHVSGGLIEMHFHFFVMVGVIALYQDWAPFLLAIAFVVGHHGTVGILSPESVYNHPAAWNNPWRWAMIHGGFVLAASIATLTAWRLSEEGFRDYLTDLPNRALFYDRVDHALLRARRYSGVVGVLYFDLDEFKTINDSLGHAAGDQLLMAVAARLRTSVRAPDTAARFGGDEFAVLVECTDMAGPALVAERILGLFREPFLLESREVFVDASIGIAASMAGAEGPGQLLRDADLAMYVAKQKGKGRFETFQPSMHAAAVERLEIRACLQRAVERQELVLHYQPIVDLVTGRIVGVEALVRWNHPKRGLVFPAAFIPVAEETGLIINVGRWVLEEACRQVRIWHLANDGCDPPLNVTVNLSGRQLQEVGLPDQVRVAMERVDLHPASLTLEITERVILEERDVVINNLRGLKALGVGLAIDDFGTGYSSLSYLQRFPTDIVKIDKLFIDRITDGREASAVARAIVDLGHSWNSRIVAEGIETAEQLRVLKQMGCNFGQGFYLGRPVAAEEILPLLQRVFREQDGDAGTPESYEVAAAPSSP